MSKKDYRTIYKKKLGIELVVGSSIHHLNLNHYDNKFNNLVLIPSKLHNEINLLFTKFPKLCYKLGRRLPFVMTKKNIQIFENYINIYKELNHWILVRDSIRQYGLDFTKEKYPDTILLYK